MQRVAERPERRLLKRLALRRMGVNRPRDVLEPRAHLQREAKRAASSETPRPTA